MLRRALAALDADLSARPGFRRWAERNPLTRPIARRRAGALFNLATGFVHAQTLAACVELDLFARLAAAPGTADSLGAALNVPAGALAHLLDAATALRLLRRHAGAYRLAPLGAALLGNPVTAMIRHHALLYRDLADPVAVLRAGHGTELAAFWRYAGGTPTEAQAAPYTALMAATNPVIAAEILDAYPIRRHGTWLDIGGGDGAFVRAAAASAPATRFILADLPAVLAGVAPAERIALAPLDLRHDPLPVGADGASLIRVLHDHDDETAAAILRAAHAALPPGGTLLIAEPMDHGADSAAAYFQMYLLAMGSGRPRAPAALATLLRSAGFTVIRRRRTRLPLLVGILTARSA